MADTNLSQYNPLLSGKISTCIPERLSILVVGDVCLDEYLIGRVSRVAPDSPVPVLMSSDSVKSPGGAANVAQNLISLGPKVKVDLLGTIGDDAAGASLISILSNQGIYTDGVQIIGKRPTTHKLRVVAQTDHHLIRIDRETTEVIPSLVEETILEAARRKLPYVQGVICSDYNKGCLTPSLLQAVIKAARLLNIPVIVDPKGTDPSRYVGTSILKPNLQELQTLTSMQVDSHEARNAAALMLLSQTDAEALLVTCGEAGVSIYGREGFINTIPSLPVEGIVCDVNGAGDTFMAAFALSYFYGRGLLNSSIVANTAAGLVVRKKGTATLSRAELLLDLSGKSVDPPARFQDTRGKVVDLDALLPRLKSLRASGSAVIFANGCFDLFHAGHVLFLESAKSLGGILVVGVNTDESIASLKGPKRPMITQSDRVRILSALACVDFVILFPDSTPARLIAAIQPEIRAQSSEYAKRESGRRSIVEEWGGRVEFIPRIGEMSTTGVVKSILEREAGD